MGYNYPWEFNGFQIRVQAKKYDKTTNITRPALEKSPSREKVALKERKMHHLPKMNQLTINNKNQKNANLKYVSL